MNVKGRSAGLIVEAITLPGSLVIRVDDEKSPAFWLEIVIKKEKLLQLLKEMDEKNDLADR